MGAMAGFEGVNWASTQLKYDLTTGDEKWKWDGDGAAYASPVSMTVDNTEAIVTPTARNLVIVSVADGKLLWQGAYAQGRYNATTPIDDSGRATHSLA